MRIFANACPLWLALIPSMAGSVAGIILPFRQLYEKPTGKEHSPVKGLKAVMDEDNDIATTRDVLYMANLTIAGVEYQLQMDTGSSDLWVDLGDNTPPTLTELTYNLTYGSGYTFGHIARGPVSFAGYDVPDQAFLSFEEGNNPIFHFGATGIVGLGFTTLSHIDATASNNEQSWGKSLLYNIFELNPEQPNFIAFALHRSTSPTDDVEGSFALGEVDDEYSEVSSTAHIPLYPVSGATRWTILMDSYAVNGESHKPGTTIKGAPSDRSVVLLDSGTTYSYADPAVAQSIYGGIEGARLDANLGQWIVPCSAGIHLTIWIGGRPFDMHPLDIVVPSLSNPDSCIGSFIPRKLSVGDDEFDWVLGTNFLRGVYSVYDFGDFDSSGNMGDPYVQLLSIVDIEKAAQDFNAIRGGVVNVQESNGAASPSVAVEATSEQIDKLVKMIPLLFAILGANGLILIVLVVGAIWFFCSRRKNKGSGRRSPPLPLVATSHTYEAVPTREEGNGEATSPRPGSRLSRSSKHSFSKHSLSHRSLHLLDGQEGSGSRTSIIRPKNSKESVIVAKRVSMAPTAFGEPTLIDAPVGDDGKDITEPQDEPFIPPPGPPPIVAPGYRGSLYADTTPSPGRIAGGGVQLNDAPVRTSIVSYVPSPTESAFEDARSHRASYYNQHQRNNSVASSALSPGPMDSSTLQTSLALQQRQEAQRAAFMAAMDEEPLPPPRRRFTGQSSGEGRQSAYNASPASGDMLASPSQSQFNRHSYAAPPAGAQRSSYVPGSAGVRRPPFNPSPFNPNAHGGEGPSS